MQYLRSTLAVVAALTLVPAGFSSAATASPPLTSADNSAVPASFQASGVLPIAMVAAAPADIVTQRGVILAETNAARAAAGLPALTVDADLDAIAQSCSERQAANDVMAHCDDYASRYPAGWTRAAENVAFGQSADGVVDAWLASPGHQANILDPSTTHIGIGVAVSASGTPYYTQDFASYPAGARPTPAPLTPAPETPAPAPETPAPAPQEPAPAEPAPAPEVPAPAPEQPAPAPETPVTPEPPVAPQPPAEPTAPVIPEIDVPDAAEIRALVEAKLHEAGVDSASIRDLVRGELAAAGLPLDIDVSSYLP